MNFLPQKALSRTDSVKAEVPARETVKRQAKVTRDRLMVEYDKEYPEYDFSRFTDVIPREDSKITLQNIMPQSTSADSKLLKTILS